MNGFALAAAMWLFPCGESPPDDLLRGVVWQFPISTQEAWERWERVRVYRCWLERNEWRFTPSDYAKLHDHCMHLWRVYDMYTDVLSTFDFQRRTNAVNHLHTVLGAEAFYAGRLPEVPIEWQYLE